MEKKEKTLNLPEIYTQLIIQLRDEGNQYFKSLTDGIYEVKDVYCQVKCWLHQVDFLRLTMEDCVYYPEISACESALKDYIDKFEWVGDDEDGTEDPEDEKCVEELNLYDLGTAIYDDGAALLKRIEAGGYNLQELRKQIIDWMGLWGHNKDKLSFPKHPRYEHTDHVCARLNDFLRGTDSVHTQSTEDTQATLIDTGSALLAELAQVISNMKSWLAESEKLDSNCITVLSPQMNNLHQRIENYVVGVRNVGEVTLKLEKLTQEYNCCKEHVKVLQSQIADSVPNAMSDSQKNLQKNTLQLIKNLCTILENN